jgi:uncharacterized protein YggE
MTAITARNIALCALAGMIALPQIAAAQQEQAHRPATINVAGLGVSTITPDMATMSFAVVKQAENASQALSDNSKALSEVINALKETGIEDRDLQTSSFSIQPIYRQFEPKDGVYPTPEITGYQVSNGVTIRVRDLSKLGSVIDTSVKLGINQGGEITFSNDDTSKVTEDARKKAVQDAMAKAKTLAETAGVKLGRVLEISENQSRPHAQPIAYAAMAKVQAESAPIAAGENAYNVTVNVTFAID